MKPGSCTVCSHPQRPEIDQASLAGTSVRDLAKRFGRNKDTIAKHVAQHIPAAAQKAAADNREVAAGDSILDEVERLKSEAKRLQAVAEERNDIRAALTAIDRLTRLVELQARLLGELRDREISITNVQLDAETATRIAETFLARRAARTIPVSAGYIGAATKAEPVTAEE
jgi:transposase